MVTDRSPPGLIGGEGSAREDFIRRMSGLGQNRRPSQTPVSPTGHSHTVTRTKWRQSFCEGRDPMFIFVLPWFFHFSSQVGVHVAVIDLRVTRGLWGGSQTGRLEACVGFSRRCLQEATIPYCKYARHYVRPHEQKGSTPRI